MAAATLVSERVINHAGRVHARCCRANLQKLALNLPAQPRLVHASHRALMRWRPNNRVGNVVVDTSKVISSAADDLQHRLCRGAAGCALRLRTNLQPTSRYPLGICNPRITLFLTNLLCVPVLGAALLSLRFEAGHSPSQQRHDEHARGAHSCSCVASDRMQSPRAHAKALGGWSEPGGPPHDGAGRQQFCSCGSRPFTLVLYSLPA